MLAKILLIIIAAGAMACSLLAIRQQRLDAAHEMWSIHHRMVQQEHTLWDIRTRISQNCRPTDLRKRLESGGQTWVAIPMHPGPAPRPVNRLADGTDIDEEPDLGG